MTQAPATAPFQHSDSDVISFLNNLITLGDVNTIDDSPDKIIRTTDNGEPLMQKVGEAYLPCALYGTKSTEVFIINPFTMGSSGEYSWFSRSRTNIVGYCIVGMMRKIIEACIAAKVAPDANAPKKRGKPKTKNVDPTPVPTGDENVDMDLLARGITDPHAFWDFAAPFMDGCNDKLLKELNTISSKMDDLFNIHYNKSKRVSSFFCMLFNEKQKAAYPSVRAGSWVILSDMLRAILKLEGEDLSEFDYKHKFHGSDTFEGLCAILIDLYDRISPIAAVIYPKIDIVTKVRALKSHMKYFGQYNSTAQWCRNTVPTPGSMVNGQQANTPYAPHTPVGQYQTPVNAHNQIPVMSSRAVRQYRSTIPVNTRAGYDVPHSAYGHPAAPAHGYHTPPPPPHRGAPQSGYYAPPVHGIPRHDVPHAQSEMISETEMQSRTNPFVAANRGS